MNISDKNLVNNNCIRLQIYWPALIQPIDMEMFFLTQEHEQKVHLVISEKLPFRNFD